MGQGTVNTFNAVMDQLGNGDHEFQSGGEDYAIRLITNAVVPTVADVDPEIADYTACSGGTYADQSIANQDLSAVDEESWFVGDSVTFDQDAVSGPTDCYYAVLYIDDNPYKCVQFWDLTEDGGVTPLSLQDAPIVINFGAGTRRILKMSVPANA